MVRALRSALFVLTAAFLCGCQSPTDPDDTIDVDDFVEASVAPNPVVALESAEKTYRITVNDVVETHTYDWKATFDLTTLLNANAADSDLDLEFPVDLTSATFKVEQASGGIRNPPTGGETEHYESVIVNSSGNQFAAASTSQTMTIDLWYDLPSLRREALVTATLVFRDSDNRSFTKSLEIRVAP
jgi:hypothetical protein